MKPFKAFLFLFIVLISFILIHYLKDVRSLAESSPNIVSQHPLADSSVFIPKLQQIKDTLSLYDSSMQDSSLYAENVVEKDLINLTPIEYAESDSLRFHYLFQKLANVEEEKLPVRILYFGDSQIENDQITAALRENLQIKFGGRGPGFIPLDHLYNPSHQLILELSKDWKVQSILQEDFVNNSLLFKNTKLGDTTKEGWFRLKRIQSLNPQPDYEIMKLYYQAVSRCDLNVESSSDLIYSGVLPIDSVVGVLDFQFNRTPKDIRFDFLANDSLNVLGISLETKNGVMVDNIALRGLSYPTFEFSDQKTINKMMAQINPGLFIFHFGVNLVPYFSNDYSYFRKHFKQQVLFLKENYPEVPVLIIGVSDMARKHKGVFESWPNIHQIKNIQREIAFETGAAFWDLEAFMGGSGGMIRWLKANPKLGRKDYAHFSKEGADKIGNALANQILKAFYNDSTVTR